VTWPPLVETLAAIGISEKEANVPETIRWEVFSGVYVVMSTRFTDGRFAIGLIVGISLTVIATLIVSTGYEEATQLAYPLEQSINDVGQCGDGNKPVWGPWFGFCFGLFDSSAQWIMMIFTIAATVLLFATLKATRKMAVETTRIGEAQTRAYVHAEKAHFFWGGEKQDRPRVEIWVRNTGQTPAHWFEIKIEKFVYEHGSIPAGSSVFDMVSLPESYEGPWNAIPSGTEGNKATFIFSGGGDVEEINKASEDVFGLSQPTHGFSIVGEIRYRTFFGETFLSQFVFGRNSLPAYECKEVRTREVEGVPVNANIEAAVHLSRYASNLKTYEKVED